MFRVDPWLIATVTILIAGFFAFVVSRVLGAHHRQPATGREGLIGKPAVVKVALNPEGVVMVKGELWRAISESGPINPGEEVTITNVDGLTLHVNKKQ